MAGTALIYSAGFGQHDPGLIKVEGNNLYHLVAGQVLLDPVYTLDKIQFPYPFANPTYHPEATRRPEVALQALERFGLAGKMVRYEPEAASFAALTKAHNPAYLEKVQAISQTGGFLAEATYLASGSYEAALLSAGAGITGAKLLLEKKAANAFSLGRPPGHHAGIERAGGFCLFNNAAIAAKFCLDEAGLQRVLILDWDLHHGDGTQEIAERDPRLTFCSLHQFGPELYPETGRLDETGPHGNIFNLPLPAHLSDEDYLTVFEALVPRLIRRIQPQMIIVSAGFDGHFNDINHLYLYDPGAGFHMTAQLYHRLTRLVLEAAQEVSAPCLFLLEGGYDEQNLGNSVANTAAALLNQAPVVEETLPENLELVEGFDVRGYVAEVKRVHPALLA